MLLKTLNKITSKFLDKFELIKFFQQNISFSTKKVGVIGVPFCKGQSKPGTEFTPKMLREHGLIRELKKNDNLKITDYGDVLFETEIVQQLENTKNFAEVFSVNKALAQQIPMILKENDQFLLLGGDHSIGMGSLAGHLAHDPNISVIWIDAHADINTNLSSPSGNMHGMPLSMIIDELKHCYENTDFKKIIKN